MQDKYIFKEEYRITMKDMKKVLKEIRDKVIMVER